MKATDAYFAKFLTAGAVFSVPAFQRNYGWDERRCARLFSDLESLAAANRRGRKNHFFGSVVYVPQGTVSSPEFSVIDGQQRITSVMLLLKALSDLSSDEEFRRDVRLRFLTVFGESGRSKVKLKQTERDMGVYEKIISFDGFSEDVFLPSEKESRIYANYVLFRSLVLKSSFSIPELYESLFHLEVIDVLLEDENPQEVFESMNSTGEALTGVDLIRNFLLMGIGRKEQEFLHRNYWTRIESNAGNGMIEDFFLYYLAAKRRSAAFAEGGRNVPLSRTSLYDAFRGWFRSLPCEAGNPYEKTESLLSDMLSYSEFFRRIFRNEGRTEADRTFREIAVSLSAGSASILLMHLMGASERLRISDSDVLDAARAIASYVFRLRIVKGTVGMQYFALAVRYFEESDPFLPFIDRVWNALTRGRGSRRFPRDREFMNAMRERNLYVEHKPSFVRYVLYKYERSLTKEVVEDENVTVEHVLPQNFRRWRRDLAEQGDSEYEDHIHRIGNLTLTKYNGELSDSPFAEKKRIYADSGFGMTRRIAERDVWNSLTIRERTEEMAKKALDLWPMPDRYNYGDFDFDPFDSLDFICDDDFEPER